MSNGVRSIERLIECLCRLPGVGPKTAERLTYHLLRVPEKDALELARAIEEMRASIAVCSRCFNLDGQDPCRICSDASRDASLILVLEDPREVGRFEETGYRGLYHVLQGRVSSIEGTLPTDLTIEQLVERVRHEKPAEVCLATNPDFEGEGTAQLVAERLARIGVKVTRLARGLPAGAQITQVSKSILADAIEGRRPL